VQQELVGRAAGLHMKLRPTQPWESLVPRSYARRRYQQMKKAGLRTARLVQLVVVRVMASRRWLGNIASNQIRRGSSLTQLDKTRGAQTRFFSFVDTVSARNFAGTNDSHGWVGLRFQMQARRPAQRVPGCTLICAILQCLQQEAIGILGVNLIYAAFYQLQTKESFLEGLAQDVVKERIEIDFVDFRGPVFAGWDRPTLLAHLVREGLAEAVFFSSIDATVPPNEVVHKKAVVLAPGSFDPRGSRSRADSYALAGRRHSGASQGVGGGQFCTDGHLLPLGGSTWTRRAESRNPRPAASYLMRFSRVAADVSCSVNASSTR